MYSYDLIYFVYLFISYGTTQTVSRVAIFHLIRLYLTEFRGKTYESLVAGFIYQALKNKVMDVVTPIFLDSTFSLSIAAFQAIVDMDVRG